MPYSEYSKKDPELAELRRKLWARALLQNKTAQQAIKEAIELWLKANPVNAAEKKKEEK